MEIEGYPNYLIYPNGDVWNKNSNKFMKPSIILGYLSLALTNNGKRQHIYIHRLIAKHYIKNPENKPFIDHIDRDRQNNNLSNLRWVTVRENSSNTCKNNEYIGVSKKGDRYQSMIKVDGKDKYLGIYATQDEASTSYKKALEEINKGLPISYKPPPPKNGYKGVYQIGDRYQAQLRVDGKQKYLGMFATPELAHNAIINY